MKEQEVTAQRDALLKALEDVCRMIETGWILPDDLEEFTAEGVWDMACRAFRESGAYDRANALLTLHDTRISPPLDEIERAALQAVVEGK